MDFVFILLLIFFFVLLYVVPSIILLGVAALVVKWTIDKFKDKPEAYQPSNWICDVCDDSEDWHKHAP